MPNSNISHTEYDTHNELNELCADYYIRHDSSGLHMFKPTQTIHEKLDRIEKKLDELLEEKRMNDLAKKLNIVIVDRL